MNNKALIERLRDIGRMYDPTDTSEEAADALEACEARIADLENAMGEFVDRCDRGEIVSAYTYSKFTKLLK